MVKMTALYKKPANPQQFDEHYKTIHIPLVAKIPGLRRCELSKIVGAPGGESPYYLMAELYFDDMNALKFAMSSKEGKAAGKDVGRFAGDIVQMMFCEIQEIS